MPAFSGLSLSMRLPLSLFMRLPLSLFNDVATFTFYAIDCSVYHFLGQITCRGQDKACEEHLVLEGHSSIKIFHWFSFLLSFYILICIKLIFQITLLYNDISVFSIGIQSNTGDLLLLFRSIIRVITSFPTMIIFLCNEGARLCD